MVAVILTSGAMAKKRGTGLLSVSNGKCVEREKRGEPSRGLGIERLNSLVIILRLYCNDISATGYHFEVF